MTNDYSLIEILSSLSKAVEMLSDNVFLIRPKIADKSLNDFIVVEIPVTIQPKSVGRGYGLYNTSCRISVYVRNKRSDLPNLKRLEDIANSVLDKFPISDEKIIAMNPRMVLTTNDDNGFCIAIIQADLITK